MKRLFIEMQEEAAQEARDQFGLHIPEEPIMTSNKVPAIQCPNCNSVHVENNTIKFK